jgi:hypothetical protein
MNRELLDAVLQSGEAARIDAKSLYLIEAIVDPRELASVAELIKLHPNMKVWSRTPPNQWLVSDVEGNAARDAIARRAAATQAQDRRDAWQEVRRTSRRVSVEGDGQALTYQVRRISDGEVFVVTPWGDVDPDGAWPVTPSRESYNKLRDPSQLPSAAHKLRLETPYRNVYRLDTGSGRIERIAPGADAPGVFVIDVELSPLDPIVLLATDAGVDGAVPAERLRRERTMELAGDWSIAAKGRGGTAALKAMPLTSSIDGVRMPGAVRFLLYRKDFSFAGIFADRRYTLALDKHWTSARVTLNGHHAGIAWFAGQRLDVTSLLHEGKNTLEIEVAGNLKLDRAPLSAHTFGLQGPVTVDTWQSGH